MHKNAGCGMFNDYNNNIKYCPKITSIQSDNLQWRTPFIGKCVLLRESTVSCICATNTKFVPRMSNVSSPFVFRFDFGVFFGVSERLGLRDTDCNTVVWRYNRMIHYSNNTKTHYSNNTMTHYRHTIESKNQNTFITRLTSESQATNDASSKVLVAIDLSSVLGDGDNSRLKWNHHQTISTISDLHMINSDPFKLRLNGEF